MSVKAELERRSNIMKKILSLILTILMISAVFSSCADRIKELPKNSDEVTLDSSINETDIAFKETDTGAKGGSKLPCRHDEWNESFHSISYELIKYVGDKKAYTWIDEMNAKEFDDSVLGTINIYSFIKKFEIPREVFDELITYSTIYFLDHQPADILYSMTAEEIDEYYSNLGEYGGEKHIEQMKLTNELMFIIELIECVERSKTGSETFNKALENVASAYAQKGYNGARPDKTAVFSIPDLVYLSGIDKHGVQNIYDMLVKTNKNNNEDPMDDYFYKYDIDKIFRIIEEAEQSEDGYQIMGINADISISKLASNRAINESLRIP